MITINEADKLIAQNIKDFPIVEKPLEECYGAVLREDIRADRDFPAFDKVLMDGIAIAISSYQKGTRNFKIEETQAAGKEALSLKTADGCIEIMTGAVIPQGCNAVIPLEQIKITDSHAVVEDSLSLQLMQNVNPKGAHYRQGDQLLSRGSVLLPPQIAVCACVGKAALKVSPKLKAAIISTGDEIVDIDRKVKPFQVRKSNAYAVHAALEMTHLFAAAMFHIKDDKKNLLQDIGSILKKFDVLVLSGGVSMGKFDFIPEVLRELGVEVIFHKVKQKPGKPFWFGRDKSGKAVFALPGNPVSTQIGVYRYVIPHLKRALGIYPNSKKYGVLTEDFEPKTSLAYFLPVTIAPSEDGRLLASPLKLAGSDDLGTLAKSDGFVEIPAETKFVEKGLPLALYRWNE